MKLTYKVKVQIYELRKQGQSFKQLSKRFGVNVSGLKYMVKLIDRYGRNIVKKWKNRYYSPKLKLIKSYLKGVHVEVSALILVSQAKEYFQIGWRNIEKTE